MKYSDRPISKPEHDFLNRSQDAKNIAFAIHNMEVANEGFVIAIEGAWGTGKTSFIELVLWYLNIYKLHERSKSLLPGYSNPEPCTIDQLSEMEGFYEKVHPYIQELDLKNKDISMWRYESLLKNFSLWLESEEQAEKAAKYWRLKKYADIETPNIIVRFSPWLIAGRAELATALLSELARAIGDELGGQAQAAIRDILVRFSDFAPSVGAGAGLLSSTPGMSLLFNAAGGLSKRLAENMSKGETLDKLRTRLRSALSKSKGKKIIIFIDDLDRLTPKESIEVVSLIKSLCDMPNVIYILSYEKEKIENLINKGAGIEDRDFLSKIVQYTFPLPPLQRSDLRSLFFNDIIKMLQNISENEWRRLNMAWERILRYYLSNPRAVKRYLNNVSVSLSVLKGSVDPIDLIVLECLKLFENDLYIFIRDNITNMVD